MATKFMPRFFLLSNFNYYCHDYYVNNLLYLKICIQPCPFVKKNKLLVLFQDISFTSKLYCSSARILWVRASINVTKSSLFPTAIVSPFGAQVILIFSPFVGIVATDFCWRVSHILTDLSPLAVLNKSLFD